MKNILTLSLILFTFINITNSSFAGSSDGINQEYDLTNQEDIFSSQEEYIMEDFEQPLDNSLPSHIEIPHELQEKVAILTSAITAFKRENIQFDYGIRSMGALYDLFENPSVVYNEIKGHTFIRSLMLAGSVLLGGSSEIIKCLSIFHAGNSLYGEILIGLHLARAALWGIDSWLYGRESEASVRIINALQADPLLASNVAAMSTQVAEVDFDPVIEIADGVIDLIGEEGLSADDKVKFDRLIFLRKKLKKTFSARKICLTGGKFLSVLTGVALGVHNWLYGRPNGARFKNSIYWLTLVDGGLAAIVDGGQISVSKKPITQKYITISEILFLSDYFLGRYQGIVSWNYAMGGANSAEEA